MERRVHTRKPLGGQNMESAFTQERLISAPKYGNGIHAPKQVVCQNMHIHTAGKPLVCQLMESGFTLECHMFNKTWKAVFFFTREFLPKKEIKLIFLKKKCFFGRFSLAGSEKKKE
jgi:hypothetical protein